MEPTSVRSTFEFTTVDTPVRFATSPTGSALRGIPAQSANAPSTVGPGALPRYERVRSREATLTTPFAEMSWRARPNVSLAGRAPRSAGTNRRGDRVIGRGTGNDARD